jgi:hypothetical protein
VFLIVLFIFLLAFPIDAAFSRLLQDVRFAVQERAETPFTILFCDGMVL